MTRVRRSGARWMPARGSSCLICGLAASGVSMHWLCRISTRITPAAPCRCCAIYRSTGWPLRCRTGIRSLKHRDSITNACATSIGSGAAPGFAGCIQIRISSMRAAGQRTLEAACCASRVLAEPSCLLAISRHVRSACCCLAKRLRNYAPTCCSLRIMAARPRPRRNFWLRLARRSRSFRWGSAIGIVIRIRRC